MNPPPAKKNKSRSESVEATYRAYDRELRWFLMQRLRGRGESAEDIRQEIYLRMLRFTDTELVREPRAYLYRVARNVLHDKLLLVARERATFETSGSETTGDQTAQIEYSRDLKSILSQLPPLHRAVLQLRKTDGLSYAEIAQKLGISVHTVKKYVHAALVQCRSIGVGLEK